MLVLVLLVLLFGFDNGPVCRQARQARQARRRRPLRRRNTEREPFRKKDPLPTARQPPSRGRPRLHPPTSDLPPAAAVATNAVQLHVSTYL